MINCEMAVKAALENLLKSSQEITTFPILKMSRREAVYWGDFGLLHADMVKEIGVSPNKVGYAANVTIAPDPGYKFFMLNDGGSSIEAEGYVLDPSEKLIVVEYLCKVFASVAGGPFSLR